MIPVLTPAEMAEVDRAAPEPVQVLVERAGAAVARASLDLLGGTYGRRVVVLTGGGNNGADGRDAARRLRARGVRVEVIDALGPPGRLPPADLVVDAAFGTGFRGSYEAPEPTGTPAVLAVDIPSGVDGLTGQAAGRVLHADRTVTFAAFKPGLLLGDGPRFTGTVELADIGLDTSAARTHLVQADDVAGWYPPRPADAHKWQSAVCVVGGGPGMEGAAALAATAALRAGAGYVRWAAPGGAPVFSRPVEVVGVGLPERGWSEAVLADADRFSAFVVGNGLGVDPGGEADVARLVAGSPSPVVVDADALTLLGERVADATRDSRSGVVLTPHEAEYERLAGAKPGPDRIEAARALAAKTASVVLLKGPCTVVAASDGAVLLSNRGDSRLATLGTGDVLAGVVAALCARGLDPFRAAATGAFLHGSAAVLGSVDGFVAGDLLDLLPVAIAGTVERRTQVGR